MVRTFHNMWNKFLKIKEKEKISYKLFNISLSDPLYYFIVYVQGSH